MNTSQEPFVFQIVCKIVGRELLYRSRTFESALQQVDNFYPVGPISQEEVCHDKMIEDGNVVSLANYLDTQFPLFFGFGMLTPGICVINN